VAGKPRALKAQDVKLQDVLVLHLSFVVSYRRTFSDRFAEPVLLYFQDPLRELVPFLGQHFDGVTLHVDHEKQLVFFSGQGDLASTARFLDHGLRVCRGGFKVRP